MMVTLARPPAPACLSGQYVVLRRPPRSSSASLEVSAAWVYCKPSLETSAARVAGRGNDQADRDPPDVQRRPTWVGSGDRRQNGVQGQPFTSRLVWTTVAQSLAITSTPLDQLATQVLLWGGLGLMGSPFVWLGLQAVGLTPPPWRGRTFTPLITLGGALLPVTAVLRRACERRRHFRVVVGCFVDLEVRSGAAAGTGIEDAPFVSQASPDWAAQRMARSCSPPVTAGVSSWSALAELGREVGVPELIELSTSLQLVGTEGARIRQLLQA